MVNTQKVLQCFAAVILPSYINVKMEQQLLQLLAETQSPAEGLRKHAESQLEQLYTNEAFPISLASIASHNSVPLNLRQAALLVLKTFVLAAWSPHHEEFKGQVLVNDANKEQLRNVLLELATNGEADRKVQSAASYVVSKIANADYPDHWPNLLPALLHLIPTSNDAQLHGALKVLGDLVEDGFNEDQFFKVARDLVKVVYDVATNDSRKTTLRALAVSVFRASFDILQMVMEDHKVAVKAFADEALNAWSPFFIKIMKVPLPQTPKEDDEGKANGVAEAWRGLIALKLQVVKVNLIQLSAHDLGTYVFTDTHENPHRIPYSPDVSKSSSIQYDVGRIIFVTSSISRHVYQ